ncbi:hypothetical protein [Kutzneria buriramensis]|uniref:Uncharacterized protein n=1 Tax=Kutzneria buriramensis TaxID=1045776 RepID=A0A3E0HG51_9PSEU|nr:hypothetical protein [Kutzneria buriramensis]REH44577.1 hypothetical protein BCF44_10857 [Kutzneria buriramensis]
MGFFGTFVFDGSAWLTEPGAEKRVGEPSLLVDIHDSDIATIVYRPAGPGSGVAYLGFTPRSYFEDDAASAPTDVAREAAGLAAWWRLRSSASDAEVAAKQQELAGYLAEDISADEDVDAAEIGAELDDAEVFVEVKTARFLAALGLPLPEDLAG